MRSLIQFQSKGQRGVAALADDGKAYQITIANRTLDLANLALANKTSILELLQNNIGSEIDLNGVKLLAPIDHEDSAHLIVAGTGLTHLGSAEGRDKMHKAAASGTTDSMRMFQMGLENGKPETGTIGAQPEWFYKGDGSIITPPGEPLISPNFAEDGGEEPEIAGIYIIDPTGQPARIGFALGNEFSDHVTEKANYLWLAHSKLRQASLGPELLLGSLPLHIEGTSKIIREGKVLWEKPFLSGEDNMSHTIENLEHHHFKYEVFCRPGDVHIHFFGTATLSFSDDFRTQAGDVFEIRADAFKLACRNPLEFKESRPMVKAKAL